MCSPSELEHAKDTTTQSLPNVESIVPKTKVSQTAYEHASSNLHPAILNHSLRVFVYAKALSKHYASAYFSDPAKLDLLFTACLFHDIGTASIYNGSQRFEVEGGDAAVKHLSQFDVSDMDKHDVWTSIAIHTSPGIAERIGELSKILRVAITTDFGRSTPDDDALAPLRENLERDFARHAIEKVLGDAVVEQAKAKPEKAPMVSWPGVLYRAWLVEPDWEGVNKSF